MTWKPPEASAGMIQDCDISKKQEGYYVGRLPRDITNVTTAI